MNSKYILSIIIATYNSKKLILPLLKSLKKLSVIGEIEFMFLDDASIDGTPTFIKKYTSGYKNIRIIKNKHMGLSGERNYGADHANGEWIWYMDDDDDIINIEKVKKLIYMLPKITSDVVSFKHVEKKKEIIKKLKVFNKFDRFNELTYYSINDQKKVPIISFPWNKVIRASIVRKIRWQDVANEDTHFTTILHGTCKLALYNEFLYSWNRRDGSISSGKGYAKFVTNSTIDFLNMNIKNKPPYYKQYIASCLFTLIRRIHVLDDKGYHFTKKEFHKYRHDLLLKWYFSCDGKHKVAYWFLRFHIFFLIRFILKIRNKHDSVE